MPEPEQSMVTKVTYKQLVILLLALGCIELLVILSSNRLFGDRGILLDLAAASVAVLAIYLLVLQPLAAKNRVTSCSPRTRLKETQPVAQLVPGSCALPPIPLNGRLKCTVFLASRRMKPASPKPIFCRWCRMTRKSSIGSTSLPGEW